MQVTLQGNSCSKRATLTLIAPDTLYPSSNCITISFIKQEKVLIKIITWQRASDVQVWHYYILKNYLIKTKATSKKKITFKSKRITNILKYYPQKTIKIAYMNDDVHHYEQNKREQK